MLNLGGGVAGELAGSLAIAEALDWVPSTYMVTYNHV